MTSSLCLGEMATSWGRERIKGFTSAGVTRHRNKASFAKGEPGASPSHHSVPAVTYPIPKTCPGKDNFPYSNPNLTLVSLSSLLGKRGWVTCSWSSTGSLSFRVVPKNLLFIYCFLTCSEPCGCKATTAGTKLPLPAAEWRDSVGVLWGKVYFFLQIMGIFLAQYLL